MNTENALNRAYANWIKDGFYEIGLGILFAGVGAIRAMIHFAGDKTPAYYWLVAAVFIFMLVIGGGTGFVLKRLKARITYPRTGYTKFKPRKRNFKSTLVIFIFAGILGGLLGVLSMQPNQADAGMLVPIAFGIVGAGVFTYGAQRIGVKRLYVLAAASIAIGLVLAVLRVGVVLGLSFFYFSIGLAMLLSGSFALVGYLRDNPPAELDGEAL